MLVKHIRCQVSPEQRAAFEQSQRSWAAIARAPGFRGQLGGWDLAHPGLARIIGLWRDRACYRAFMQSIHDEIFRASGQANSYRASAVTLLEARLELPGAAEDLPGALAAAAAYARPLLRTANCRVPSARQSHFETVQARVWRPAMSQRRGMLGGTFARGGEPDGPYLAATLWASEEDHASYVREALPGLRQAASATADLSAIEGGRTLLEPGWTVLPGGSPGSPGSGAVTGGA